MAFGKKQRNYWSFFGLFCVYILVGEGEKDGPLGKNTISKLMEIISLKATLSQ